MKMTCNAFTQRISTPLRYDAQALPAIRLFGHQHRRGGDGLEDGLAAAPDPPEAERAGRTGVHAGRAAHALGVLHRQPLVGEAHDVDALVAHRRAHVAADALLLVGEDAETGEARVDVHERRQRAGEATPDAPGEPEVEADADDAGEEHVDDVVVVVDRVAVEGGVVDLADGVAERRLRPGPAHDARGEQGEAERQNHLTDQVYAIPAGAVRHFLALGVADGLGEGAAAADPAAVGAFAPATDDERDEHEGL